MGDHTDESRLDRLIAQSSLGTPGARDLRRRTSQVHAQEASWLSSTGYDATVVPLAEMRHHKSLAMTCVIVVESVLDGWNPGDVHQHELMTASAYLRLVLGDRLAPGRNLSRWAAEHGVPATVGWVSDGEGGQVRNPLALASDDGSKQLLVQRGNAHGDLNANNILVRKGDPQSFKLIDFASFANDAPLARDPVYLLLSLAREWLSDLADGSPGRHDLMAAIVNPQASPATSVFGSVKVSAAFHEAGQNWADRSGFGEHWRQQELLSLIGCALIFVGRARLPGDVRQWFFDLSVRATHEYLLLTQDSGGPPARQAVKPSAVGVPRSRAEIDAVLCRQLPLMQRTLGNKDHLVDTVLELLEEQERFVCLVPCRLRGITPGSAIVLVSDRYVHAAELDFSYHPSTVAQVPHSEIRELQLFPGSRRLGLLDTADVRIATDAIEVLARGLLRPQAESLLASLEKLTGVRR
ncbi:hypothetical protein [Nonomuraea sp. NPDC049625]|uniref:hypothetical protein n=1 Tax=Nonomuraea sp. NPDC049625 TaxID=3155775 RepID=UPI0034164B6A